MLRKILGYDLKFGKNSYLLMAGAVLLVGLFNLLFKFETLQNMGLSLIIIIGSVVIAVACVILVFQNFNKTIFGPEGYLTLTLPVKRRSVLFSKLITTLIRFNVMLAAVCLTLFMISGKELNIIIIENFDFFFVINMLAAWLLINVIIVNAALYLYMALTLSNISLAGIRPGWIFGGAAAVAALALEIYSKYAFFDYLFGFRRLWIVKLGTPESFSIKIMFAKDVDVISVIYDYTSYSIQDLNLVPAVCMISFSVIAWFVTLHFLKKKVDLP
jgi:hypothetical protein